MCGRSQHDADLWPEPYRFNPARFLDRSMASDELIPQGGGDTASGHRCPGEDIPLALLTVLSRRLAGMAYSVPVQDLSIRLHRAPVHVAPHVAAYSQLRDCLSAFSRHHGCSRCRP